MALCFSRRTIMGQRTSKPFSTLNQQLKILRSRGLEDVRPDNAKRSLEQIGYYTLINGYKRLFLKTDNNGKILHPEKFQSGASFDYIKFLYNFDAELRSILYKYILKYETMLGAEIAYRFSEKYPDEHSYLALDNFDRDSKQVESVVKTINDLSGTIDRNFNSKTPPKRRNAIEHYVNNYGHVPLWVLVNFLTFGQLRFFYANCTSDLKETIAKDFKKERDRSYEYTHQAAVSIDAIDNINKIVNKFRNAIAHSDITYSFKLKFSKKVRDIQVASSIDNRVKLHSQAGIFELIIALNVVLSKRDYTHLKKELAKLLKDAKNNLPDNYFQSLLTNMNMPPNYNDVW